MNRILIIEDEIVICELIRFNLESRGYEVTAKTDGAQGLESALNDDFDLILLDIMLPSMNGFEVCRKLREKKMTPVIMLTARDEEEDKITGLDLGADDYITKPFSIGELIARIGANIRRSAVVSGGADETSQSAANAAGSGLVLDESAMRVYKDGRDIELSVKEYELLRFFYNNEGKVFSRETLLSEVWGYNGFYGDLRTVDVNISRLRERLSGDGDDTQYIRTKRGAGYYFQKN